MTQVLERIRVKEVLSARYKPGMRPESWDKRIAGFEIVATDAGQEICLYSTGGQSTPAPGWELLLTQVHPASPSAGQTAFEWTLYGLTA